MGKRKGGREEEEVSVCLPVSLSDDCKGVQQNFVPDQVRRRWFLY